MKLKDLLAVLNYYNPEADVRAVAYHQPYDFSITYGESEGCDMSNCETVNFYLDELCVSEKKNAAIEVEKRFIREGKFNIFLAVATEHETSSLECLNGLCFPIGSETKAYHSFGRKIDDNYNNIVIEALEWNADYIITVEDDTFPPPDAIIKLVELVKKYPKSAIGGWYPKREEVLQGTTIILKNGKRQGLEPDGEIHEVYTLPMGCTIYPIEMFKEIASPWFITTEKLTQDSYFSQLARENGWKLLVDTSIRCKHVDRVTGKIYE